MTAAQFLIDKVVEDQMYRAMNRKEWLDAFDLALSMEREQLSKAILHALDEDGHTGDWKLKFAQDYVDKLTESGPNTGTVLSGAPGDL
jgi:hypothetical protein